MATVLSDHLARALATAPVRFPLGKTLQDFLGAVRRASPFLDRLILQDESRLGRVLAADPRAIGFGLLAPRPLGREATDAAKIRLRRGRTDFALALALADLAGALTLDDVLAALSAFAETCVADALLVAFADVARSAGVAFADGAPPADARGIAVIAMGKLGAAELNYSSDIDLVAIYDPDRLALAATSRLDARAVAIKTIQGTVDILSQQTMHGYVFRTDLRLRPNPAATPLAVSLTAAERYYEEYGQNWERAAFIKGRPVAGDMATADQFMSMIRPFVWRRTLDFGAVADIHAVKRQIHAVKGNPELKARGGNIKLGPGGIREIEFFAQTQQLLLGGRNPALRVAATLPALSVLTAFGHVPAETSARLTAAYRYLRMLEHRLQMREDAQTQTMPTSDAQLDAVAAMMGMDSAATLLDATEAHLRIVHDAYAELYATPGPRAPVPGSLVFTGVDDDPRTLETLRRLHFQRPELVTARIRRWHQAGLRATRSVRARELLTALVPRILTRLGELEDPDAGFSALDGFLDALPGGSQVFALFTSRPDILDDVIALCDSSPQLAARFGRRPALLEGLVNGLDTTPRPLPPPHTDETLEDRLDLVRRAVNAHRVRASAVIVLARESPAIVADQLALMADAVIGDLVRAVREDAARSGRNPAGDLAVIGFGRLGTRRLTVCSDLDLVFVYDPPPGQEEGDPDFARLVRRIVSALSVSTQEGGLYTIDMQLRPSGGAGPAAVLLRAFDHYYREDAWVWEAMALTKARVITGSGDLPARLEALIAERLVAPRQGADVARAVAEMRGRLLAEKPPRGPFDAKRLRGGLTDVDFLAQGLALIHGATLGRLPTSTEECLNRLGAAGVIAPADLAALLAAYACFEALTQYARAAFGNQPPATLDPLRAGRLRQLSPAIADDDIAAQVHDHSVRVTTIFDRMIGQPVMPSGGVGATPWVRDRRE